MNAVETAHLVETLIWLYRACVCCRSDCDLAALVAIFVLASLQA